MKDESRLAAIDQFRGFAILLMVLADYLSPIQRVPSSLKHAADIGLTPSDVVAPLFITAIGLTYDLSFRRRLARSGRWATYEHFIGRNLALIGLGCLLTLGGAFSGLYESDINWGLLQAIGAAGLLALPVMRLSPAWRAALGLGLLAAYQMLLDRFWLPAVLAAPHNGPWGALSWAAMLILATALADLYHAPVQARRAFAWAGLAALGVGLLAALIVPISKHRASASYALVCLGLSAIIFWGFHLLAGRGERGLAVLTAWGRNPLLLYLLHGVIIGLFALPPIPAWYVEAPGWLIPLQAAALLFVLSATGVFLERRRWYWKL